MIPLGLSALLLWFLPEAPSVTAEVTIHLGTHTPQVVERLFFYLNEPLDSPPQCHVDGKLLNCQNTCMFAGILLRCAYLRQLPCGQGSLVMGNAG